MPLAGTNTQRVRAACLLFDPQGQLAARYDKVHLFDVQVLGSSERYAESATIEPGECYVTAATAHGQLGLAVCYDVRFPEQFRALLDQGMEILALPAAFTAATGKAHWETLLRARAIENQCYVIAAAQGGQHANGRETYGDSLIIDPWGEILDRLPQGPGVVLAHFDRQRLEQIRQQFPALRHRVVGSH
jgi:nitrilase